LPSRDGPEDGSKLSGPLACITSRFLFNGTAAANAHRSGCDGAGDLYDRTELSLATVAQQSARVLAANIQVTLLTGSTTGCAIALSLARLSGLPAVCFGQAQAFPLVWVNSWPGLAAAVAAAPRPRNVFTLQLLTDPYSNCLTPRLGSGQAPAAVFAAAGCSFVGRVQCDAANFSYALHSPCVRGTHPISEVLAAPGLHEVLAAPGLHEGHPIRCTEACPAAISECPELQTTLPTADCSDTLVDAA